ncbi:2-succinyl-6-hydroxy-2,4-cyclohexadiene-1-carboxylate synthase [Rossellomorea aquimaris]|uniref:2-succinyl-6-hydroxy-2, 4-cyclohexadiene-1-carboxylate synthase n=1 Tax=Rossellomorea aquimaris TaxID=189382 RepID=UPI0007D08A30|nr:2-succinyl-6-hydroxy-2,4-cyclohexadiene-1-carboxylate synthase [Rossellomorea aquimaris]
MILQVNDIRYYVDVKGEGSPLVFLHGFTGDTTTWSYVTSKLSEKYQCISVDIIGHGQTDSPEDTNRYSMDAVAKDLQSIFAQLQIEQATIVGYSMGGRLALHFSMVNPELVKALLLESASPGIENKEERRERSKRDHMLAENIMKNGIQSFVDFWENVPLFSTQQKLPKDVQERIRQQRLRQNPTGLANSLLGMGTGEQPSWWGKLECMSVPVFLLVGEQDEKFKNIALEMKERNSSFQIVTFFNVGHAIHVEEPRKFGTIIENLLLTT